MCAGREAVAPQIAPGERAIADAVHAQLEWHTEFTR